MPTWSEPLKSAGNAHDFNAEEVFEAVYLETERIETEDKFNGGTRMSTLHRFERAGEPVVVWGTADLDGKMRSVPKNTLTRIVFIGTEQLESGRSIKRFSVQYDTGGAVADPVMASTDDDIPF